MDLLFSHHEFILLNFLVVIILVGEENNNFPSSLLDFSSLANKLTCDRVTGENDQIYYIHMCVWYIYVCILYIHIHIYSIYKYSHKNRRPKNTWGGWGSYATLEHIKGGRGRGFPRESRQFTGRWEREGTGWTNFCRAIPKHWNAEGHLTKRLALILPVCHTQFKHATVIFYGSLPEAGSPI